jgi:AcrR family transcriptional regulator
VSTATAQRARILDTARELMAERGAAAASMRELATRCGLNVATLYHYFPSKAELLRAVIADRGYLERLALNAPPVRTDLAPRTRFVELFTWLWASTLQEESVWRLLIGEALRGEHAALVSARTLAQALDVTFVGWLGEWFPELTADADAVARLMRGLLFSLVVEHLATGDDDAEQRAADLATLVLPA